MKVFMNDRMPPATGVRPIRPSLSSDLNTPNPTLRMHSRTASSQPAEPPLIGKRMQARH